MLERDLQEYLFNHPEVLFPEIELTEKRREHFVEGRRIDLLFRAGDVRHIIELKAVPLTREHVGQIAEYYGLMRSRHPAGSFTLTLVAPSIPGYRSSFLEQIGIRCVEIPQLPDSFQGFKQLEKQVDRYRKLEREEMEITSYFPGGQGLRYIDLAGSVSQTSLAISHRVLADTLNGIRKRFDGYEVLPSRIRRAESGDFICGSLPLSIQDAPRFTSGGAWWAYTFGQSECMPKNDVPNLSFESMPWGLSLSVNAEIQASQRVMLERITCGPDRFDRLVEGHGSLQFQALLKIEHQPRMYHWLPLFRFEPGAWDGKTIQDTRRRVEQEFEKLRSEWIQWIVANHKILSKNQIEHMRRANRKPILALRLARTFREADEIWNFGYEKQCNRFIEECAKLKALIDFFVRT